MKTAQEVILAPVITEKSMTGIADKKYVFKVAKDATKVDIAAAVAELFKLDRKHILQHLIQARSPCIVKADISDIP